MQLVPAVLVADSQGAVARGIVLDVDGDDDLALLASVGGGVEVVEFVLCAFRLAWWKGMNR